jgi:hypothetical protein
MLADSNRARIDVHKPRARRRFRRWLAENYRLLYGLNLIATYALLMLYIASRIMFGDGSLIPKVALGILSFCGFISFAPFMVRGYSRAFDDNYVRAYIMKHRSAKVERIEMITAAVLWAFILVAFLLARHFGYVSARG